MSNVLAAAKALLPLTTAELTARRQSYGRTCRAITTAAILLLSFAVFTPRHSFADVPQGDPDGARRYFRSLATTLGFSTPDGIFDTTLDDVARYFGYGGLQGIDLQNLPPAVLMNPDQLVAACPVPTTDNCANTLRNRNAFLATLAGTKTQQDDILAIRFFAPKIMNIHDPEATRKLGWRKLVRLRARPGSAAQAHHIGSGIILFNIFTEPGAQPFSSTDESVNTQVMLVTELPQIAAPNTSGLSALYWLDYDRLSSGGKLSLALNASFDANELPASTSGTQPYFVPDGCVACHGNNQTRSMVNYLDTDHWYDRLDTDFPAVKALGLPLVFDAQTNDTTTPAYRNAFDVIRRFNEEADAEVRVAQPTHDEALASAKWLALHGASYAHFPPIERAIGAMPQWSSQNPNDARVLGVLNQYCFRCHGTVKFSVFDKQAVQALRAPIIERIGPDVPIGERMPPDRDLTEELRALLHDELP
jgi:hypothetical protein